MTKSAQTLLEIFRRYLNNASNYIQMCQDATSINF